MERCKSLVTVTMISILIGLLGGQTSCSLIQTTEDEVSIPTPNLVYHGARIGMVALKNLKPDVAAAVCAASKDLIWPMLENATTATIEMKDDVIDTLAQAAEQLGTRGEWLEIMDPSLDELSDIFALKVVFEGTWLDVLKGFVGGVIDACDTTETHKPE